MMDLYLKATDEAELIDEIPFLRGVDDNDDPVWITSSHDYALDIIGTLYNDDALYDGEGVLITPATPIDAFHANLRCTDEISLLVPIEIQVVPPPSRMQRLWF